MKQAWDFISDTWDALRKGKVWLTVNLYSKDWLKASGWGGDHNRNGWLFLPSQSLCVGAATERWAGLLWRMPHRGAHTIKWKPLTSLQAVCGGGGRWSGSMDSRHFHTLLESTLIGFLSGRGRHLIGIEHKRRLRSHFVTLLSWVGNPKLYK